jgi:predicted alternative tryptophan synthase beta-subunit
LGVVQKRQGKLQQALESFRQAIKINKRLLSPHINIGNTARLLQRYDEAIQAFLDLCRCEGIIPAMESAHAIAFAMKLAPEMDKEKIIVINLSGRAGCGDHCRSRKVH